MKRNARQNCLNEVTKFEKRFSKNRFNFKTEFASAFVCLVEPFRLFRAIIEIEFLVRPS